jgi:hypothetical protein
MEIIDIYDYNDNTKARHERGYIMGASEKGAEPLTLVENRMWSRLKCDYVSDYAAFGGRWYCQVVNLSQRGLGIVSSSKLNKGDVVNFTEPRTKAQVVWVEDSRAGLKILN